MALESKNGLSILRHRLQSVVLSGKHELVSTLFAPWEELGSCGGAAFTLTDAFEIMAFFL